MNDQREKSCGCTLRKGGHISNGRCIPLKLDEKISCARDVSQGFFPRTLKQVELFDLGSEVK